MTNSANYNHEAEHIASIKMPTDIVFCKHTALYILNTKLGLVVKGHLVPFCIFLLPRK